MPLALILLANQIRAEAPDTFQYFDRQGATVKVISGDNPITVSEVAKRADICATNCRTCADSAAKGAAVLMRGIRA